MVLGFILLIYFWAGVCFCSPAKSPFTFSSGNWYLQGKLDNRMRLTSLQDYEFINSSEPSQTLVLNRLRINMHLEYKSSKIFFLEALDAREWGYHTKNKDQSDLIDLHQAYIQWMNIKKTGVGFIIGRQKLNYGKKRLVAAPTWGNKVKSFDAVLARGKFGNLQVDAFSGSQVLYEHESFNKSNFKNNFFGIYGAYIFSPLFILNGYVFNQFENQFQVQRFTTGCRLHYNNDQGIIMDGEAAIQSGNDGDKVIRAYAWAFYIQKKLAWQLHPSFTFETNISSGDTKFDDKVNETFIPLYQAVHGSYGIIDFFRWQNIRECAIIAAIEPKQKLNWKPIVIGLTQVLILGIKVMEKSFGNPMRK